MASILPGPEITGKVYGCFEKRIIGPVKFPDNGPDKLTGPKVTGTFEKRAPGPSCSKSDNFIPSDESLSSGAIVLQPMLLASFPHNPILKFDLCFYPIHKL